MKIIGEDGDDFVVMVSMAEMRNTHPQERVFIGTILPLCPELHLLPPSHDSAVREHAYRNAIVLIRNFEKAARDNRLAAYALLVDIVRRIESEIEFPTL